MDFSMQGAGDAPTRWRISVLTRLVAVLAYAIPLVGGALSSFLLINTFQALKQNEAAGIVAVMAAVKESALPATYSIYLAAFAGFIVIVVMVVRALIETKTASPPLWFFALCAVLCLIPAGLFWRAEWLMIEALSPGGSVGAGGIAAVGAQIANLLLISVVSAPVVFLILVIAFAIPFKSRSKLNWNALVGAGAVEILLIAAAVAAPFLIAEPQRKKELVELPQNIKAADEDADIQKETSVILIMTADNKLYFERKNASAEKNEKAEDPVTKEELPERLRKLTQDKPPDKRIVYLKADVNAVYENVLQIFDIIRKNDLDKVGLVTYGVANPDNPYQLYPKRFEVRLPEEVPQSATPPRPNPLLLLAALKKDGKIELNKEDMGTLSDPQKLISKLRDIFKDRENMGVLREGTNEVEKTVFLKVAKDCKYSDFIKLVEAVKTSGAQPIGIQLDDFGL